MRSAFAGPTVGSIISCSSLAVLMLSLPVSSFADFLIGRSGSLSSIFAAIVEDGGAALAIRHVPPIAANSRTSATRGASLCITRGAWPRSLSIAWGAAVRIVSINLAMTRSLERHATVGGCVGIRAGIEADPTHGAERAARRVRRRARALLGALAELFFGELAQLQGHALLLLAGHERQRVEIDVDRVVLVDERGPAPHPVLPAVLALDRANHFELSLEHWSLLN